VEGIKALPGNNPNFYVTLQTPPDSRCLQLDIRTVIGYCEATLVCLPMVFRYPRNSP
jgi:hypothetical protein